MPQPSKIPLAFAASGDKNIIPESTKTTGLASWREGFPAITSAPFSEGGIAPKRADFNGIFNALSQAVIWMQQGGVYAYDSNTDYEAGNVVLDAGGLYVANAANGPSSAVVQPSTDATGATWKLVRLDLATQTAAGYMSGADKTKLDGLISTDATPTAAGYMSAADKNKLDGLISTDATPTAAGYMSAEDKKNLTALLTNGDYELATIDTSIMTGSVNYKRFGRLLIVSVEGKLNSALAKYSSARLASGLPNRDEMPGTNFHLLHSQSHLPRVLKVLPLLPVPVFFPLQLQAFVLQHLCIQKGLTPYRITSKNS